MAVYEFISADFEGEDRTWGSSELVAVEFPLLGHYYFGVVGGTGRGGHFVEADHALFGETGAVGTLEHRKTLILL